MTEDNLKMKVEHFFVVQDEITQRHSTITQQNWLLNREVVEASNICFCIVKTIFISDYFIIPIYSVVDIHDLLWKNEMIKAFLIFGCQSVNT